MDDDFLGGPPIRKAPAVSLFDDDDDFLGGGGSGNPNVTFASPKGAAAMNLMDDMDLLGGPPPPPPPRPAAAAATKQHQQTEPQTMEETAAASVRLAGENKLLTCDIAETRAAADALTKQIEAMKLARGKGTAGQVEAQLAVMQSELINTEKAVADLTPIRDRHKAALAPLEAAVAECVRVRVATVVATHDAREQADMMKSAQEFEIARNIFKRRRRRRRVRWKILQRYQ